MNIVIYDWMGNLNESVSIRLSERIDCSVIFTGRETAGVNVCIPPSCNVTIDRKNFGELILALTELGLNVMIVRDKVGKVEYIYVDNRRFQTR